MEALITTLQSRYASIESNASKTTDNTSIELPKEIADLITGSDFWIRAKSNRYKMLIRQGHFDKIKHLAALASAKNNPANWFAKACSKANWEKYTLPFFAKLEEVSQKAMHVAERLGAPVSAFIYKQVWSGRSVERWAAQAQEVGRNPIAYFAWLCNREVV